MIDPANMPKVQYSIGNQGLRRYTTYTVSETYAPGAWTDDTITKTVYENDNSEDRFKDYSVVPYGNFSGGPNNSARWYDAKSYSKSALYRELLAGPTYNFIFDIKQTRGVGVIQYNGVSVTVYQTVTANIYDTTTIRFVHHILYNPYLPGDFVV